MMTKLIRLVGFLLISTSILAGCNLGNNDSALDESATIVTTEPEPVEVTLEITTEPEPIVTEEISIQDNTVDTTAPLEPVVPVESANTSSQPSSSTTTCTVRSDWFSYRVVAGDTLSSIARRAQTTVAILLAGNCLSNANLITVGQQLVVPNQVTVASQPQNNTNTGVCTVTAIQDAEIFPLFGGTSVVPIGTLPQGQTVTIEIESPSGYWGYKNGTNNGNYVWLDPRRVTAPTGSCDDLLTMFDIRNQQNDANPNTAGQNQVLRPSSFDIQPRSTSRGGTITVSWNFPNTVSNVEVWAEGDDYRGRLVLQNQLPSSGTTIVSLPADNRLFTESAQIWIQGSGTAVSSRITIQIECPFVPLYDTACPQYGADNANIVYQAFENGFMIYYNETMIIASDDGFIQHAVNTAPEADDTFTTPDPTFIVQWQSGNDASEPIYEILGSAINDAQRYTGTWQQLPNIRNGYKEYVTLPDGQILIVDYFGRAVSWQIVN